MVDGEDGSLVKSGRLPHSSEQGHPVQAAGLRAVETGERLDGVGSRIHHLQNPQG